MIIMILDRRRAPGTGHRAWGSGPETRKKVQIIDEWAALNSSAEEALLDGHFLAATSGGFLGGMAMKMAKKRQPVAAVADRPMPSASQPR